MKPARLKFSAAIRSFGSLCFVVAVTVEPATQCHKPNMKWGAPGHGSLASPYHENIPDGVKREAVLPPLRSTARCKVHNAEASRVVKNTASRHYVLEQPYPRLRVEAQDPDSPCQRGLPRGLTRRPVAAARALPRRKVAANTAGGKVPGPACHGGVSPQELCNSVHSKSMSNWPIASMHHPWRHQRSMPPRGTRDCRPYGRG